ncbi:MAG: type IV pilus assembly protein PilM [Candidatus Paceibacterota bacterium]
MANFLSSMFGNLFGSSGGNTAIGIDIGTSAIKVVQLKKEKGKVKLVTYGALALGPYADKHVGQETDLPINTTVEALTDLLREAKTSTKQGGIAIPFSSTLMTILKLPDVEEKEFEQMVPIEARKYVPTSLDEVSLDWTVIPKGNKATDRANEAAQAGTADTEEKEKVDVLMVAIRNDIVDRYKRVVSRAELDALFFEVEIFSTIRAVISEDQSPVMVIDMGAGSTKVYVIEDGIVRRTHTVNTGSVDLTETIADTLKVDPEAAEILKRGMSPEGETRDRRAEVADAVVGVEKKMLDEIARFAKEYQGEHDEVTSCVLVGGGVLFEGFQEKVEAALQVPTSLANPFKDFVAPAFLDDVLAQNGPEFAVATGIALRRLNDK